MNIKLKTEVEGNYKEIMKRFDRQLFEALKPKNAKMEILEFTGSKKGDLVHLQFLSPIKTEWISEIVEHGEDEKESYFIDVGVKLPFPLSQWKHKHIVQKVSENTSMIIDDMSFKGPNFLVTLFLYPALYIAFYPRKRVYKSYFKNILNRK